MLGTQKGNPKLENCLHLGFFQFLGVPGLRDAACQGFWVSVLGV